MKRTLSMLFVVFAISCTDEPERSSSPKLPMLALGTTDEYEKVADAILQMNDGDFKAFERSNKYVSYKSKLEEAYVKLHSATSEEQLLETLKRYNNVLEVKDDLIVPIISFPLYQKLANENGFFESHSRLFKVVSGYIYSVAIADRALLENGNNIKKSDKITIMKYTSDQEAFGTNAKTPLLCPFAVQAEYFMNYDGCSSDRKLYLIVKSYNDCNTLACKDYVNIRAEAFKRTWLCNNYVSYNTSISWRNVSFQIPAGYYEVPDNNTTSDTYLLENLIYIGSHPYGVPYNNDPPRIEHAYGEATSSGINGNWAILNYHCQ